MGAPADAFVKTYITEMTGKAMDLERLVTEPSGLDAPEMMAAFAHRDLGRLGITMMADFMAPEGSIYYDAIFGAYRGQHAIRGWLVPAMADIEFIDFAPTAESVTFDDGEGGSSLDEWQMVMNLGDTKMHSREASAFAVTATVGSRGHAMCTTPPLSASPLPPIWPTWRVFRPSRHHRCLRGHASNGQPTPPSSPLPCRRQPRRGLRDDVRSAAENRLPLSTSQAR